MVKYVGSMSCSQCFLVAAREKDIWTSSFLEEYEKFRRGFSKIEANTTLFILEL